MTGKQRVCIVTPGQLGSNPRTVKEAEALTAAGFAVRVVATKVTPLVEPRDQAILSSASFLAERVAFDSKPVWRAERLRQEAARRAWAILQTSGTARAAYSPMTRLLTVAACSAPADLYIAHYVAALPAAASAARRCGGIYAFDAEDFHLGDLPDNSATAPERRLIRTIEGQLLPGAAYVTSASPGIADAYAAEYGIERPRVVLNTFPRADAPGAAAFQGSVQPRPTLYWFSQTIGPNRGLECAVQAVAKARTAPHLHLRGTPSRGFETELQGLAASLGIADRLHLHPPAAPMDMARLAAQHDVGLVSETGETRNRRIALTNKQFVYLLAGIPMLMSDVPAHVAFAQDVAGAARLYRTEDADALAASLDAMLEDGNVLASARARAFALGQERFNWETESPSLVACVSAALAAAGRRSA